MGGILRRLRGALGNAVVWASGWALAGLGLGVVLHLGLGLPIPFWSFVLGEALSFGTVGLLAGGAFSLYLGVAARRRTLAELKPLRFALSGGLVAGLVVPAFLFWVTMRVGYLPAMETWLTGAGLIGAALGGTTAYGTLKLAQRASLGSGGSSARLLDHRGEWG